MQIIITLIAVTASVYYYKIAKKESQLRKELSNNIELLQNQLVNSKIENRELVIQIKKELMDIKTRYNIQ